jgi:hypothetical protein
MDHYYIYCLHNEDLPEYYVGHTKDLNERWKEHIKKSKKLNFKVYKYIRSNGGINNFKMEVLDEIYCDKQGTKKLERYYMELLGATLNSDIPGRTKQEYDNDNKQKLDEYRKKYLQDNKQEINKKHREYHQKNKQKIREKDKIRYQKNKQKKCEKQKEYRQNNKQEICEKKKVKFTCICGSVTRKSEQTQHFRTKKHIDFIRFNIGY